jgi:hypothetical protein
VPLCRGWWLTGPDGCRSRRSTRRPVAAGWRPTTADPVPWSASRAPNRPTAMLLRSSRPRECVGPAGPSTIPLLSDYVPVHTSRFRR